MCVCQGCGTNYTVDFVVPDDLWEEIKPENKQIGAGLLCGSCIAGRIEDSKPKCHYFLDRNRVEISS
jgi:hypothetical protein